MIVLLTLSLLQTPASALQALPSGAVHTDMSRRGGTAQTGAASLSPSSCIQTCAVSDSCVAWTFIPTQTLACRLHDHVGPLLAYPGALTGLSPALAHQIETAADRAPSAREQAELDGS